jgi:hypothetical protein
MLVVGDTALHDNDDEGEEETVAENDNDVDSDPDFECDDVIPSILVTAPCSMIPSLGLSTSGARLTTSSAITTTVTQPATIHPHVRMFNERFS